MLHNKRNRADSKVVVVRPREDADSRNAAPAATVSTTEGEAAVSIEARATGKGAGTEARRKGAVGSSAADMRREAAKRSNETQPARTPELRSNKTPLNSAPRAQSRLQAAHLVCLCLAQSSRINPSSTITLARRLVDASRSEQHTV